MILGGSSPHSEFIKHASSISFSPDGTHLLLSTYDGSSGGQACIITVASGQVIHQLGSYSGGAPKTAFSPDGRQIVTAGDNGHALAFWDTQTGQLIQSSEWGRAEPPIRSWPKGPGSISSITFSPDGNWVVLTSQLPESCEVWGGAWIYDARTGEYLRFIGDSWGEESWSCIPGFASASFSPDGKFLVTGSGGADNAPIAPHGLIAIWDMRDLLARLRLTSDQADLQLHWDLGILQFAPSPSGPWTDLPAASPFQLATIGEQGFFRVKVNQ
jgi:WD40 repeat protein